MKHQKEHRTRPGFIGGVWCKDCDRWIDEGEGDSSVTDDCDCICHIAGQWAHCYDCDPPTLTDELREQGRRGLTGAEFVLLMLGYGEGDS